jgi:DMSO/TMAO reductase YedYZ molybdopterin-dependent catalytic subunit
VAELTAALTGPLGGPVTAVGEAAINLTPVPVKEFAIAHFGTHDKQALVLGILVLLAGFAAVTGMLAVRRLGYGLAGLAAFAAVGVTAAVSRPGAGAADVVPTLAGAGVAAVTLVLLVRAGRATAGGSKAAAESARAADTTTAGAQTEPGDARPGDARPGDARAADARAGDARPGDARLEGARLEGAGPGGSGIQRRRVLVAGAGAAALAAGAGGLGDFLLQRSGVAPEQVRLPAPSVRAAGAGAGAELRIPGLTPFLTPNASFYRVDTDLVLPQLSPRDWTLRIDGMVAREAEISFGELLRMPLTEAEITLVCVSNEVGGTYNGNARWLGVPLAGLLRRAGVRAGADQVLSSAADGMTISTPIAAIMDGRNALLAVGMNGQPLPVPHGFPARMVVPGLYGYVSATKWVTRLTVTTFAARQAYWTKRGYAAQAPVRTESRIDVPKPLAQVRAGHVTVAGMAWAPHRGSAAVEVSADNGPWQRARLASGGLDTWRQWAWTWDAAPGLHQLRVRAADSTGATQTPRRAHPFPSGASGWDSVVVTAT